MSETNGKLPPSALYGARMHPEDAADDYIDACYAEWLMAQPEAMICNSDTLIKRMEQQWGWEDFVRHFTGGSCARD